MQILIERMRHHTADEAGRLLRGFSWYEFPMARAEGKDDFPAIQLFIPDIEEKITGRLVEGTLEARLAVSTLRRDGIPKLLDEVARVLNAVETDEQGRLNTGLQGSLICPMELKVANCFAEELSLNAEITVSMKPRLFDRGAR